MNRLSIENENATQINIDNKLYEIPYRFNAVIEYNNVIAFHCYPKVSDGEYFQYKHDIDGGFSLFVYSKNTRKLIWKYANVEAIDRRIPEEQNPDTFISNDDYLKYMEMYGAKDVIVFYAGEFKYLADANTGGIYDKMESR